eukprot:TRINITY_DN28139_c0_g3_i3.p2 TRINITY_DN28139_c0_g3~~TRINITY_DN28139_c0_g3_i3.p2  ORF type:complete len:308 (-),score=60.10 TRINITY_DN28139_c0_g3_i3:179-1102(-)
MSCGFGNSAFSHTEGWEVMPGKLGASRSTSSLVSALGGLGSSPGGGADGHVLQSSKKSPLGGSAAVMARTGYNSLGPLWCTTDSSKRPPPLWSLAAEDRHRAISSTASPQRVEAFAEERAELQGLWKGSAVNRFYDAIEKIPRFDGPPPDPRKLYGDKEPTCYTGWGERRHVKIIDRWESLPQLRGQLKAEFLETIADYSQRRRSRPAESAAQAALRRGREKRAVMGAASAQQITETVESPSKRAGPFIACNCCEKEKPKPWLQQKNVRSYERSREVHQARRGRIPIRSGWCCCLGVSGRGGRRRHR